MGEITPFASHCAYLGLFILLSLGPLGLPVREDTILFLGGILVTVSVIKVLPEFRIFYPGLLMTDLLLHSVEGGYPENERLAKVLAWLNGSNNKAEGGFYDTLS